MAVKFMQNFFAHQCDFNGVNNPFIVGSEPTRKLVNMRILTYAKLDKSKYVLSLFVY